MKYAVKYLKTFGSNLMRFLMKTIMRYNDII